MSSDRFAPDSDDPDRLLARWRALLAQRPHLHGRQAAALLQVPEAALIASRIGDGAVRLAPSLPELLDGIEHWRKIFVVTPNRFGVSIAILDARPSGDGFESDGPLLLLGDQHRIVIDTRRVQACYLFEDRDAHGRSLSLCWFDERGNSLGKLFLRSRRGQEFALPKLMARALPEQSRRFEAASTTAAAAQNAANHSAAVLCEGEPAARLARAALIDSSRFQSVALRMTGTGLASSYHGALPNCSEEPQALHLAAPGCKLHLRPAAARTACAVCDADGNVGVHIDVGDGSLAIAPRLDARVGRQWLDALLERSS